MPSSGNGSDRIPHRGDSPVEHGEEAPFRDAEAWLAERGVERRPLVVAVPESAEASVADGTAGEALPAHGDEGPVPGSASPTDQRPVSHRDAGRLAAQSAADAMLHDADARAHPDSAAPRLEDDVVAALAFLR